MTSLTPAQYGFLTQPIAEGRIQHLRGQSHVEQWDIRRHLIRAFGFGGFDVDTKALVLVREIEIPPAQPNGKPRWTVVYRAELRLTIKGADGSEIAHYEDGASGDSQNQPSLGDAHDQAMKTALSQALKRCAVNLGDQFGLSLYNGGRADAVVLRSLVAPAQDEDADTPPLPADERVEREPGAALPSETAASTTAEPAPAPAPEPADMQPQPPAVPVEKLRELLSSATTERAVDSYRDEGLRGYHLGAYAPDEVDQIKGWVESARTRVRQDAAGEENQAWPEPAAVPA